MQGERYPTQNFGDRDGGLVEASNMRKAEVEPARFRHQRQAKDPRIISCLSWLSSLGNLAGVQSVWGGTASVPLVASGTGAVRSPLR